MFVYVAGPITPKNDRTYEDNRRETLAVVRTLRKNNIPCVSPLLESASMKTLISRDQWMAQDEAILRSSACVVACLGWENSEGTLEENKVCRSLDIPFVKAWSDHWLKITKEHLDADIARRLGADVD
jgi:hypothetical protein